MVTLRLREIRRLTRWLDQGKCHEECGSRGDRLWVGRSLKGAQEICSGQIASQAHLDYGTGLLSSFEIHLTYVTVRMKKSLGIAGTVEKMVERRKEIRTYWNLNCMTLKPSGIKKVCIVKLEAYQGVLRIAKRTLDWKLQWIKRWLEKTKALVIALMRN